MLISENTLLALNDIADEYLESACERLGYKQKSPRRRISKKRIITFSLAATLVLSMGAAVYAIGEIFEIRTIQNDRTLKKQSEQGSKDIEQFTGEKIDLIPGEYAIYMDNEIGQSGITNFDYWTDQSNQKVKISYYDSGEVHMVDARALFTRDYAPYKNDLEWFNAKYPEQDAYKASLIKAIPELFDALYKSGWIKHSSQDINKTDILNIHLFWDGYAQMRILTKDDCGYELWLEPETLTLEGFMYWNAKDTQNIRNGFFIALKEDRLEEWWAELMAANSVG